MYKHFVQPEFLKREPIIDAYIQTAKDWGVSAALNFAQRATTAFNKFILQALNMAQAAIVYNMTNRGAQPNFGSMVAGFVQDQRMLPSTDSADGKTNAQRSQSHLMEEHQNDIDAPFFEQRWFSQDDLSTLPVDAKIRASISHSNLVSGDNRHCPTPIDEELMIVDTSSSVPDIPLLDETKKKTKTTKPRGRKPRESSKSRTREPKPEASAPVDSEQQPRKRLVRGAAKKAQKKLTQWNHDGPSSDSEMN